MYSQTVQDIDINKNNILINGDVQSGKTSVIIELALKIHNENKNVFIFVNNFTMDLLQIKTRFDNYFSEKKMSNSFVKIIDKKIKKKDISEQHSIYICLCNASKISDINLHFKNMVYSCIIDESDLFNQDADKNDKDTLNKVSKELNTFLSKANPIVRVTATSFSHMYVNEVYPLKGDDVYFMNKKDSYISYGHEKFVVMPIEDIEDIDESENDDNINSDNSDNSDNEIDDSKIIENDGLETEEKDYQDYQDYQEIIKKEPDLYLNTKTFSWTDKQKNIFFNIVENDRSYFESKQILPIMIVNVSTLVRNHSYIKSVIEDKYKDITTILINESSVLVDYGKKLNFDTVQDALTYIKSNIAIFNSIKRFNELKEKSELTDSELKELKKLEDKMDIYSLLDSHDHKMIIIITCLQMGRGISPRSEVKNFKDISSIIYANSIIYCCSRTQSVDKIIQGSMRIGGQFPGYEKIDGFELRLHTTQNIINSIETQYDWINEIKENIINNPKLKLTELVTPLKEKPLRKPMSNSRGKFKCKKINGLYECTEDRIEIAKQTLTDGEIINDSIISKILTILKENKNKLTSKEIKNKGIEQTLWKTDNDQLYRNITSILSKLPHNIQREKNSDGIYVYWL